MARAYGFNRKPNSSKNVTANESMNESNVGIVLPSGLSNRNYRGKAYGACARDDFMIKYIRCVSISEVR